MENKKVTNTLIGLLALTIFITILFTASVWNNFESAIGSFAHWESTGQVGDFFGGVVGTIVSAIGSILIYLTLKEQGKAQKGQGEQFDKTFKAQEKSNTDQRNEFLRSEIEGRFFELLRLHKENLSGINYDNPKDEENNFLPDRKAVQFIVNQVEACYGEIALFFYQPAPSAETIYQPKYLSHNQVMTSVRSTIDLVKLAHLDISYSIVFYGTSEKDLPALKKLLAPYYRTEFTDLIFKFIRLKSVHGDRKKAWQQLQSTKPSFKAVNELFSYFEKNNYVPAASFPDPQYRSFNELYLDRPFDKFYGGHQYKLGQYFRHLFQTVKYINGQTVLSYEKKYDYLKTLRAQLSTVEQTLIFYNSTSFMGRAWELDPVAMVGYDAKNINFKNLWLFTKFNIIKNIPDLEPLSGIMIQDYYPEIAYEFEGIPSTRKQVVDFFEENLP